jgi:5'-deoxynucleotidase YfbR-like HD superfamily hydrolase
MQEKHAMDPRQAGQLTRYHTWARIRDQSVGEHSWQVTRILLAIWPDAPRHLLVHCLVHDVGELRTGDLPYPVKSLNPAIKESIGDVESSAHLGMCAPWALPPPQSLTEDEKTVFKLAEYAEMLEWSFCEMSLGNRRAHLVAVRCHAAIKTLRQRMDHVIQVESMKDGMSVRGKFLLDVVARYELYIAKRLRTEREIYQEATI